jgi:Family of unknown function (DUF6600)/FecR protein
MTRHILGPLRVAATLFAAFLLTTQGFADSQARVVRLSTVEGDVQIDRNTGDGFEQAFLNLPVVQGVKLHTGANGRAEVEFENGSTIRIAPETSLEFSELSLRDSGAKVSRITVREGLAYVSFRENRDDEFSLAFARQTVTLSEPVHLRIEINDTDASLAVFKGQVRVEGASGETEIGKGQSVTFDLANRDQRTLAENIESSPFDQWDNDQDQYHKKYSKRDTSSYASGYGASDLNYYGSFSNVPGYGMLWQPYFVSAGWDPFMDGMWAFYPGAGYVWVSSYPWGWTPYHCGSWRFLQSFGWMWQPGQCLGWGGFPRIINPPPQFVRPTPPATGQGPIVWKRKPPTGPVTGFTDRNRIKIANDSAGLGIPRGGVRDLSRFTSDVRTKGSITTSIHVSPLVRTPSANPSATTSRPTYRTPPPAPRTVTPRAPSAPQPAPMPRSPAPRSRTPK